MSAERTSSGTDGEHDGASAGSSLPPLVARELANRRARGAEGGRDEDWREPDRPRHARAGGARGAPGPARAGAVGVAGLVFVVAAVLAAVAVLWPRDDRGGTSIEASGVTTTVSSLDGVAEREPARGTTVPEPSTTGTTGTTGSPTTPAPTDAAPEVVGDDASEGDGSAGGSATSAPASPPPSDAPPSTAPAPAPERRAPSTTTTTAAQRQTSRPGNPDDHATWDALARCESGGNWSADPGNGRYGGLMIDDDTWDRHGGRRRPHMSSRETQIEIARRIQHNLGWGYWHGCATRLGFR